MYDVCRWVILYRQPVFRISISYLSMQCIAEMRGIETQLLLYYKSRSAMLKRVVVVSIFELSASEFVLISDELI